MKLWQKIFGLIGLLGFAIAASIMQHLVDANSNYAVITAGYLVGFITALGLNIFWGSFKDEVLIWPEFKTPLGILSQIPVLLLFLLAFTFFSLGVSGKIITTAAISAAVSGILVDQGVYPLMLYIDKILNTIKKTCSLVHNKS